MTPPFEFDPPLRKRSWIFEDLVDSRNYHDLDIIWARRRREKIGFSMRFTKGKHHFGGPKSQFFRACGGLQKVKTVCYLARRRRKKIGFLRRFTKGKHHFGAPKSKNFAPAAGYRR